MHEVEKRNLSEAELREMLWMHDQLRQITKHWQHNGSLESPEESTVAEVNKTFLLVCKYGFKEGFKELLECHKATGYPELDCKDDKGNNALHYFAFDLFKGINGDDCRVGYGYSSFSSHDLIELNRSVIFGKNQDGNTALGIVFATKKDNLVPDAILTSLTKADLDYLESVKKEPVMAGLGEHLTKEMVKRIDYFVGELKRDGQICIGGD